MAKAKLSHFSFNKIKLLFMGSLCLFFSPFSNAQTNICSKIYIQSTPTTNLHDNFIQGITSVEIVHIKNWFAFENYHLFPLTGFKNILFISDGHQAKHNLITDRENQFIISTDINNYPGINLRADNNRLPFADNSFDFILMNRGLCVCEGGTSCGGIQIQKEHMQNFVEQAVRILDKKRSSLAIFTGYNYRNQYALLSPKLWRQVIAEAQLKYPTLQFAILNSRLSSLVDSEFIGFAISSNPWDEVSTQINRLSPKLNN